MDAGQLLGRFAEMCLSFTCLKRGKSEIRGFGNLILLVLRGTGTERSVFANTVPAFLE